jgi:uncharacterized protein YbjT (DUF2867 family)
VKGDVLDAASLIGAFEGVDVAYYLVHSMGSTGDFERHDRVGARNFSAEAARAGVRRIIYLGGLGSGSDLSPHLRSRQEVGDVLRASGVPTIELRASIVIGSGSLSFEMVRSLTERLPIMITPRWVETLSQPIAIEDLLAYLDEARHAQTERSPIYEVGGTDRVSYGDIMREYARQRGLRRVGQRSKPDARRGRRSSQRVSNRQAEGHPGCRPPGIGSGGSRICGDAVVRRALRRW